jgi:hypothetical protein
MAIKINDTVEFFGNEYIAVEYKEQPAVFFPNEDDDQQCRVCQLSDNYCKIKDDCHGDRPFVFVKDDIVHAMGYLKNI